jgi:hypothetical protein
MARTDPRSRRRAGEHSRVERAAPVGAHGLGSGLVLLTFALLLGPLATVWEGPALALVRSAIRGDVSPTTAFVGLLTPVLVTGLFLSALTIWGARRASGLASGSQAAEHTRDVGDAPSPWSVVPLVVPLVVALVVARAAHWWVFSVHAAAADSVPLLLALSNALVWVCAGLGTVLVVASLVSLRSVGLRSGLRGSRPR